MGDLNNTRSRRQTGTQAESAAKPKSALGKRKAGRLVEESADEAAAAPGLSSYELQRLEQIRINRERMSQLDLPGLMDELAQQVAAAKRPVVKKPKVKSPPQPRRVSLRARGEAAEMPQGILSESRTGAVVLAPPLPGSQARPQALGTTVPTEPEGRAQPSGDQPFASVHGSSDTDAAYLARLKELSTAKGRGSKPRGSIAGGPTFADVSQMRLAPTNVAKVTSEAIVCLEFMPGSGPTSVLAVGDKRGNVGLWTWDPLQDADGDAEADGIVMCLPHRQYVSGLSWLPQSGAPSCPKLLTSSYDGSVAMLDAAEQKFLLVHAHPEDEYSAMGVAGDGNVAFLGDPYGNISAVDIRAKSQVLKSCNIHNRKINSVHFQPGAGSTAFATSCSDGAVCIWDVRKLGTKPASLGLCSHDKSCHGAYFAPDGSKRVLSTSYDNTVRVWTGDSSWVLASSISHNNQTGRWISPFRAIWTPDSSALVMGDMRRAVFAHAIDGKKGQQLMLESEAMTAIPSRLTCHHSLPVIAAATSSGRVHFWTRS